MAEHAEKDIAMIVGHKLIDNVHAPVGRAIINQDALNMSTGIQL